MDVNGFQEYVLANGSRIKWKRYPPMPGFINIQTSRGEFKARGGDYYIIWPCGFESILSTAAFMDITAIATSLAVGALQTAVEKRIDGLKQELDRPTNPMRTKLTVDEQGINVSDMSSEQRADLDATRVPVIEKKVEGPDDPFSL